MESDLASTEIVILLDQCEKRDPYFDSEHTPRTDHTRKETIELDAHTHILIASDLHLSAGRMGNGNYSGTENFFADDPFKRFLGHHVTSLRTDRSKGVLILNGDFVDLLRVVRVPEANSDFEDWVKILNSIGVRNHATETPFDTAVLRGSIEKRENKFGLKTNDYKSVWKLAAVIEGHPVVFDALADWLKKGHTLVIIKGNHDLEWIWKPVRDYLRLQLARRINPNSPAAALKSLIREIRFVDDALVINNHLYIEHGQRYDPWTRVLGPAKLGKFGDKELNIPMGSFLNRYVLNMIELSYPFIDNVRPLENFLPMLIREHLPLGLRALRQSIYTAVYLIPKKYFRYVFARVLPFLLGFIIPAVILAIVFYGPLQILLGNVNTTVDKIPLSGWISTTILMPILGYFWMQFVAWLQISEPTSLAHNACNITRQNDHYTYIVMGHTHDPEQTESMSASGESFRYFNTGTWIPIVETSSANLREDKTYTYLHFRPRVNNDGATVFEANRLERWNDDTLRPEDLVLIEKK